MPRILNLNAGCVQASSSSSESEEEEADERLQAVLAHSLDALHSHKREHPKP